MLMSRANLVGNLALGIGFATFGAILLVSMVSDASYGATHLISTLPSWLFGFDKIFRTTQSLELTPSEIIYQTAFKIVCVEWDEIGNYVLDADRFVALGKQNQEVLLDLTLNADHQSGWPCADCAQAVEWIEHKMPEIGATRQSATWLHETYGIHIS